MDKLPLSVIVPVYQVEHFLPRCLDSILNQSFLDFELILVDDGSRDGSAEIMARYAANDSRIVQLHKENGGLSSARNAGLNIARGKYILFIDSDDYISPGLFEAAIRAAETADAEQVTWRYCKVDDRRQYAPWLQNEDGVLELEQMGLGRFFFDYWFSYRYSPEVWNKLYRRDVIEKNRLRFRPNDEILAEDLLFNVMYALHMRKLVTLRGVYSFYYQRDASIMSAPKPCAARRLMELAVQLSAYAEAQGMTRELRNALPVLCYLYLFVRGIQSDPNREDLLAAMAEYGKNPHIRAILWRLITPVPLTVYTLHTRRNFSLHVRARLFAARWLRGNVSGAAALILRGKEREENNG